MRGTSAFSIVGLLLATVAGCGSQVIPTSTPSTQPEPTSPYLQPKMRFMVLLAQCMTAEGLPTTFDPVTEALSPEGVETAEDRTAAREMTKDCTRRIDPQRLEPPDPTEPQWREMHAYLLAQVECLRDLGHSVPNAPGFGSWRGDEAAWDPYNILIEQNQPAPIYHVQTCQNVDEKPAFFDW